MSVAYGKYDTTGEARPMQLGVFETGVIELVGINEQIDQNDYGAHVTQNFHGSGMVVGAVFHSSGGDILQVTGKLLFFNNAVSVAAGDTAITVAERNELIGWIEVDSNWQADANGASQCIPVQKAISYDTNGLYLVWFHESATSLNSAAEDDELLTVNLLYMLEHRE